MRKAIDDALLDFYQQLLKPEFDALKAKLAEHDRRFDEIRRLAEAAEEKRLNFIAMNREV